MKNILDRYVSRYGKKHRDFRRYAVVVAVLALVVFVGVNWRLHDKGISMTSDYQCGLKEHKHTGKCYKNVLICSKEETDGSEGHTHTDACYKEEKKLTCGKEEHKHNADCYDEDGNLICGKEEHAHSEQCYTTEKKLICGKKESKPVAAHHHTDACYKKELICGLKEHTHTAACYSDESADVEKTSDWEATIPELTGNWAEDIVSVAQSQLGYEESTANFKLADDGKTRKGYTRYGEWYGNKYGDWSAMFASFCLNYAGIPSKTVPVNSGCPAWITELKQDKLYKTAANYTPAAGDIVFLDTDSDGKADHAGIITETKIKENTADNKVTSLTAIVGDSSDKVEENTYKTADDVILGYCALPENPDEKKVDTAEGKETESTVAGKAEAKSTETEKQAKNSESTTAKGDGSSAGEGTAAKKKAGRKTAKSNEAAVQTAEGVAVQSGEGSNETYASFTPYVTSLEGEGTKYNKDTGNYTSDLKTNFKIPKSQIKSDNYRYELKYPEGIIVPDELLNHTYRLLDEKKQQAGTYYFVKNADGTYTIRVIFEQDYVNNTANTIEGNIWFVGKLSSNKVDNKGDIIIAGEDKVNLNIPGGNIEYPDDETNKYNIDVSKAGSVIEGGKLKYTVIVTSTKGTPEDIDFTDVITTTGIALGTPEITVKKQPVKWYSQWYHPADEANEEDVSVNPTYDISKKEIKMTLPQLTAQQNNDHIDCYQYVIIYTYDIEGRDKDLKKVGNTVNVMSHDQTTETTVKKDEHKDIDISYTIKKEAQSIEKDQQIKWTITVNENKVNIAGATITDTRFSEIPSNVNLVVNPTTDYVIEKDKDGQIKDIKFLATSNGQNNQKYTITYYTPYTPGWNTQTVSNTATLNPETGENVSDESKVDIPGGSVSKKENSATENADGTATVKWTVSINVPSGKIPKTSGEKNEQVYIYDNMESNNGNSHYMTVDQIKNWDGMMQWNNSEKPFDISKNGQAKVEFKSVTDEKYYTLDEIRSTDFDSSIKFKKMRITLLKDLVGLNGATTLTYCYETTADLNNAVVGRNTYTNNVKVENKSSSDTYTYIKEGVIKKDGNGNTGETTSTSENELKWKIEVVTGNNMYDKVNVTDVLPKGLKLKEISVIDNKGKKIDSLTVDSSGKINGKNETYMVNGTYGHTGEDNDRYKFDLSLVYVGENEKIPQNSTYTFNVVCQTDDDSQYMNGQTYTFTNSAKAKFDNKEIGSSSQTQKWTKQTSSENKVVNKFGKWDNDSHQADYSIVLNPDGKDIVEGSDVLTLTDILDSVDGSYSATTENGSSVDGSKIKFTVELIPTTVKLYYAVKNSDGTYGKGSNPQLVQGYKWTYTKGEKPNNKGVTRHTIVMDNIPDSTPLYLEYRYSVDREAPDKVTAMISISNTATLSGQWQGNYNPGDQWKWSEASTGGEVSTKAYTIYKVEKGNYGKLLEGAVFKLQKCDVKGNYSDVSSQNTFTTDSNGMIQIKWDSKLYDYNTLYKLIEIEPPSGYKLSNEDTDIYFYFSNTKQDSRLPDNIPTKAIDLTKQFDAVYVENESNTTSISVKKNWKDSENQPTSAPVDDIRVDLYRKLSTVKSGNGTVIINTNTTKVGTVNLNYPIGTKVTYRLSYKWSNWNDNTVKATMNGEDIAVKETTESAVDNYRWRHYDITFTIEDTNNINIQSFDSISDWEGKVMAVDEPQNSQFKDEYIGNYTIKKANDWQATINNLPLTGKKDEQTVYYSYYVREQNESLYKKVDYSNNEGITSGTITVTNTTSNEYTLPETGGSGTLPFIAIGASLMGFALLCGYSMRRRRGRRVE